MKINHVFVAILRENFFVVVTAAERSKRRRRPSDWRKIEHRAIISLS
jgi:hypothetical protein